MAVAHSAAFISAVAWGGVRVLSLAGGFAGEYRQKVDAKGRVSVPADLRVHFAEDDAAHAQQGRGVYVTLNFSPTLKNECFRLYSSAYMARLKASIAKMKAGSREQKMAQFTLLQKTKVLEIDADGRIVVPKQFRDQFGITDEALFLGSGDYVEVWDAGLYAQKEQEMLDALLGEFGENFDPVSLVDMSEGDNE